MKQIWKFELRPIPDEQLIRMPRGSKIVHGAMQNGKPCLWAEVDPTLPVTDSKERAFFIRGTGHNLPVGTKHIATVYEPDVFFVWHILERTS